MADFDNPRLAISRSGVKILTWRQKGMVSMNYHLMALKISPEGDWMPPMQIDNETGSILSGSQHLAIDDQGNAFAVWQQGESGTLHFARYINKKGWQSAASMHNEINDQKTTNTRLQVLPDGRATLVWLGNDQKSLHTMSFDPVHSWGAVMSIEGLIRGVPGLGLNFDREGQIQITFLRNLGGRSNNHLYQRTFSPHLGWLTETRLDTASGNVRGAVSAVHPSGGSITLFIQEDTQKSSAPNSLWAAINPPIPFLRPSS